MTKLISEIKSIPLGKAVTVEALMRGEELIGLGEVVINGVTVRSRELPLRPCVETPEGFSFNRMLLKNIETVSDGVVLHLESLGEPGFYSGGMIDYHYERVPSSASGCCQADLDIILKAAKMDVDGLTHIGFSYRYVMKLKDCRAYQLLDKASWEIGGRATGNTIVSQGQCNEPEHRCTLESAFHTWVANARIINDRDEMSFLSYCFTPRFASMQCFDFLNAAAGSLLVFYDQMEYIKGSVFKESGQDVIYHYDLHTVGMTDRIEVPAKFVLLHQTSRHADHEFRNRWTSCRDFVFHRYQEQYGIQEQYPQTEHHSWLDWECDNVYGHHVYPENSKQWYYELADTVVPAMKEMGFERFFEGGLYRSFFTEIPDEHYPNFTILDYEISENFGGLEGLKYFCRKCRENGLDFSLWLECGLSAKSPILAEHPDWVIHDPHLDQYIVGAGYIRALDLNNDEVFEFLTSRWTKFVKEVGITGIFHDSFSNIGAMKVNFNDPERRPQHRRLVELVKYFQDMGMDYSGEGGGPFVIQHGGLGSTDDKAMGECVYAWFRGREYALYRTCRTLGLNELLTGNVTNRDYFQLLANQSPLSIGNGHRGVGDGDPNGMGAIVKLGDEFAAMQKAYNKVRLMMGKRTLLPDEQGVLWKNSKTGQTVVYTFKDLSFPISGRYQAEEHLSGRRFDGEQKCDLNAGGVYAIAGDLRHDE